MLFGLQPIELDAGKIAAAKDRLQTRMEQDPSVPSMQPGGIVPANLVSPSGQPQQSEPAAAFKWGQGGQRLTAEDIASRRTLAQQQMAAGMDTSPVRHWSQGLARVAQALVGSMQQGKLDAASERNAADSQLALSALGTGGGERSIAAILANPYVSDGVRDVAKLQWQATHKTPVQPHYWETNNGSLAALGPDGKPQIVYADPDPKMNFVPDGMGGGNWVPVPTMQTGGAPEPAPPSRPVGKLTPITGGAPSQGGATFP